VQGRRPFVVNHPGGFEPKIRRNQGKRVPFASSQSTSCTRGKRRLSRPASHHHGDLDHPIGPLLYTISCMHCMTGSLA
jgi:hypothetical protein